MNIVVCALDNPEYNNNAGGKNPAFICHNGRIYIKEMISTLIGVRRSEDEIYVMISEEVPFLCNFAEENRHVHIVYHDTMHEQIYEICKKPCAFLYADNFLSEEEIIAFYNSNCGSFIGEDKFFQLCKLSSIQEERVLQLYEKEAFPDNKAIPELFKKAVHKYADNIALICGTKKVTYKELDELSDSVANQCLNLKNAKKELVIGILMERGIEYIVAMIGILKAGMSYVPMSMMYPLGRLKMMQETADIAYIITREETEYYMHYPDQCLLYEQLISPIAEKNRKKAMCSPENIAYIMFTSGSTGKPKGVKISHRNIVNNAFFLHRKVFQNKESKPEVYGVVAEFIFDMSVQQIYPALLFGKTLRIYPANHAKSPEKFIVFLNEVDATDATPIMLGMLTDYMEAHEESCLHKVHLVVGGEKLPYKLCKRFFEKNKESEITNIYGPTECTVEITTFYLNSRLVDALDTIPIGKPVDNSRIYVVNEENKFVMPNELGEICAAGECVGHGYANASELTKKVYVTDIFKKGIMYRTGDYGFWNEDGQLCFAGRRDRQVKVRGYRIDLEDIENTIMQHAPVSEIRVLLVNIEQYGEKLVGYFISKKEDITLEDIIEKIKDYLPEYMIPAFFVPLKAFPLNMSGKLDKSWLPDCIEHSLKEKKQKEIIFSEEDTIATKIIEFIVLHYNVEKKRVAGSSLRSIGCDSINLIQILSYISTEFSVDIPITAVPMQMQISQLIELVKGKYNKDILIDEIAQVGRKKKKYHCLPMQSSIMDTEYEYRLSLDKTFYGNTMIYMWGIKKGIDYGHLKDAISHVVNNNDAFFLSFHFREGDSRMERKEQQPIKIVERDIPDVQEETIMKLVPELKMDKSPLAYIAILTCAEEKYLLIAAHHIIFDYLSCFFFLNSIQQYYYEKQCKPCSFLNSVERIQKKEKRLRGTEEEQKIKHYLSECKPVLFRNNTGKSDAGRKKMTIQFTRLVIDKVRNCVKNEFVSEFDIYLCAFLHILHRVSNQDKLTVGTFINGRSEVFPIETVGFFSRFMLFHHQNKREGFLDDVRTVQEQMLELEKKDILVNIYDILQNMKEQCNVLFDYQKLYMQNTERTLFHKATTFEILEVPYDFVLRIYDLEDTVEARVEYTGSLEQSYVESIVQNVMEWIEENA